MPAGLLPLLGEASCPGGACGLGETWARIARTGHCCPSCYLLYMHTWKQVLTRVVCFAAGKVLTRCWYKYQPLQYKPLMYGRGLHEEALSTCIPSPSESSIALAGKARSFSSILRHHSIPIPAQRQVGRSSSRANLPTHLLNLPDLQCSLIFKAGPFSSSSAAHDWAAHATDSLAEQRPFVQRLAKRLCSIIRAYSKRLSLISKESVSTPVWHKKGGPEFLKPVHMVPHVRCEPSRLHKAIAAVKVQ